MLDKSRRLKKKNELDIDCVLERTSGMLAEVEVSYDPTGQV